VRLVGVPRAEASADAAAREAAAHDAAARVAAASAVSTTAAVLEPVAATVSDTAVAEAVEAPSSTIPLSPATLMVGLAAARSRTLASAAPRPAPPAGCDNAPSQNAPVVENFDSDIAGMTGLPGRKMYYGRSQKNALAAACRRGTQAANSTP
jgi:hypothetical protein